MLLPGSGPSNSCTDDGPLEGLPGLWGLGTRGDGLAGMTGLGLVRLGLGLTTAPGTCVRASAAGEAAGAPAGTLSGAANGEARGVQPGTVLGGSAASLAAKGRMCCVKVVSDRRMSEPLPGRGPLSPSHCMERGSRVRATNLCRCVGMPADTQAGKVQQS